GLLEGDGPGHQPLRPARAPGAAPWPAPRQRHGERGQPMKTDDSNGHVPAAPALTAADIARLTDAVDRLTRAALQHAELSGALAEAVHELRRALAAAERRRGGG